MRIAIALCVVIGLVYLAMTKSDGAGLFDNLSGGGSHKYIHGWKP